MKKLIQSLSTAEPAHRTKSNDIDPDDDSVKTNELIMEAIVWSTLILMFIL